MSAEFDQKEGEILLKLARASIAKKLGKKGEYYEEIKTRIDQREHFNDKRGVFVSLHKHGKLRGCIGNIESVKTVGIGVEQNAQSAAFNDTRFNPLSLEELSDTQIEISILTKPEKIDFKDSKDLLIKLRPEMDGVVIEKNHYKATFLPQVWTQLPDPKAFLSHLCTKAGLPANEWEQGSLAVYTYQVQLFEES
ncbi:MAG: AmmeMemoRadiSam system protein A [Desulfobacteraceae bacterium]|nr:AmmeMemoRadiSam system protein A [Desulfobacteraceae bacterium]